MILFEVPPAIKMEHLDLPFTELVVDDVLTEPCNLRRDTPRAGVNHANGV